MEKTFIKIQGRLINTRNVTKFVKNYNKYIEVYYNVTSYSCGEGGPAEDCLEFDSESERDKAFEKLEAILSCVTLLD